MDEFDAVSVDDIDSQSDSPVEPPATKPSGSGITLVLPSLKSLKAANASKKGKKKAGASGYNTPVREKRAPRPLKLKPLKEVLTKLIAQIKKKDDYAFFLQPVDTTQVQGYTEIVKHPMDFGTMTNKVARGRYRSLEEFADDFRLVINNAKSFNLPGTIYYTEAQRIETWGLDHIAKAAGTVIQYETDWNIEVEDDEEPDRNGVDDDADAMDVDTPAPQERSGTPGATALTSKRTTRGPYRKSANTPAPATKSVQESIDAEGRLPGSKDGLGAFPAGSDWAAAMLALKLKGKRYKTKKERLRFEKEGPPLRADGSLDYWETEDPFPILSALVPDPPARPYLTPLYPPLLPSTSQYTSQSQTPQPPAQFPTAVNLPREHTTLISDINEQPPQFRYWTIQRNVNARNRTKDKEEERDENDDSDWKVPREAHTTDFGSYALLAAEIAEEMKRRGTFKDEEEGTFSLIRESLDPESSTNRPSENLKNFIVSPLQHYWSVNRAIEGESYIRDVVYGGANGLSYVRSVAEFLTPPSNEILTCVLQDTSPGTSSVSDVPLTGWAEQNVVDPLTDARHSLLRQTPYAMARLAKSRELARHPNVDKVTSQVSKSMHIYPVAIQALLALKQIRLHKIDMSSLIKAPEELFQSEEEWVGKSLEGKKTEDDSMNVDGGPPTADKLDQVLTYVSRSILETNRKLGVAPGSSGSPDGGTEDSSMRHLRLNLLALAKRAPIDTIARLPRDMVPEQVRPLIPTFSVGQPAAQPVLPAQTGTSTAAQVKSPTPGPAQPQLPAAADAAPTSSPVQVPAAAAT
ncbi:hypothetical protein V5O48_003708 [Marasmius crinis-equi]|uniref:Bromo domain-containing protein n=1 Tax=Marasmius crinis-equi TaxID=585013 RepID=A0ABR3FSK5_9AGAR